MRALMRRLRAVAARPLEALRRRPAALRRRAGRRPPRRRSGFPPGSSRPAGRARARFGVGASRRGGLLPGGRLARGAAGRHAAGHGHHARAGPGLPVRRRGVRPVRRGPGGAYGDGLPLPGHRSAMRPFRDALLPRGGRGGGGREQVGRPGRALAPCQPRCARRALGRRAAVPRPGRACLRPCGGAVLARCAGGVARGTIARARAAGVHAAGPSAVRFARPVDPLRELPARAGGRSCGSSCSETVPQPLPLRGASPSTWGRPPASAPLRRSWSCGRERDP